MPSAIDRTIDHQNVGGSGEGEFGDDGTGGTPGAEDQCADAVRVDTGIHLQSAQEALAVRVLADQAIPFPADGVDRSDQSRVVGDFVQIFQDGDLMRNGQVSAGDAERAQTDQGIAQFRRGHLNGEVAPVEAEGAEGRFLHDARGIFANRIAETRHQAGREVFWHQLQVWHRSRPVHRAGV